jgi:heat shock protein HslJ
MRPAFGFLFFMLFLAGFALVTLKNLRSAESIRHTEGEQSIITIISGAWYDRSASSDDREAAFVRFHQDGRISGFAGCNNFFGTFVATDKTLEVGPLGSTRKACTDLIMRRESDFLRGIESATDYRIGSGMLTLSAGGIATLQLEFMPGASDQR